HDLHRFLAGPGDLDFVASRAQQRRRGSLDRGFVIDEQNPGQARHYDVVTAAVSRCFAGMIIVNCAPPSAQFSVHTRSRSAETMPCTIARSMPMPGTRRLASAPR